MTNRGTLVCLSLGTSAIIGAALWWANPEYVEGTLGLVLVDISRYPQIRIHPAFLILVAAGLILFLVAIVLVFVDRARASKVHYRNHG
jgi:hypothetical protein